MEEKKNINVKISVKVFETIIIWLLGFNLLIGILEFFKILNILNKTKGSLTSVSSFVDLVSRLVNGKTDLHAIEKLASIHRAFILITVIVVAIFIIIRFARKEQKKLFKFIYMLMIGVIIFSNFLIFLTKDLFYAIKSINERIFTEDFSKTLYLLQRMQNIKDTKYIIIITFFITMFLSLLAIIIYVYEMLQKEDKVNNQKLNLAFYIGIIIIFFILAFSRYSILKNANNIDPFSYYVLGYDIDENNKIIPVSYVDYKKVERKYLDPYLINFLEQGLRFDIKKEDRTIETNKNMKVDVSYNVDVANELDLRIKKINSFVKNKEKPILLQDINKLNKKSLIHLMKKYDIKYLDKAIIKDDENTGIYYTRDRKNNLELYVISKVKFDAIPIKYSNTMNVKNESIYQIIYIGNVFVNEKGEVLSYTGINNNQGVIFENSTEIIKGYISQYQLNKY